MDDCLMVLGRPCSACRKEKAQKDLYRAVRDLKELAGAMIACVLFLFTDIALVTVYALRVVRAWLG